MINIPDPILIGRLYFKRTINGNLLGEFSNNQSNKNSTESADLITKALGESFIGEYITSWCELNTSYFLMLNISYKLSTLDKIYSLVWLDDNKNIKYWGEGFLCDDLLIGDYRNFENTSKLSNV